MEAEDPPCPVVGVEAVGVGARPSPQAAAVVAPVAGEEVGALPWCVLLRQEGVAVHQEGAVEAADLPSHVVGACSLPQAAVAVAPVAVEEVGASPLCVLLHQGGAAVGQEGAVEAVVVEVQRRRSRRAVAIAVAVAEGESKTSRVTLSWGARLLPSLLTGCQRQGSSLHPVHWR